MTREDFRRELGDAFDDISGSPNPALPDRVRSALVEAPEHRGPVWIAALAAAVIAVLLVGVLLVANPLSRPSAPGGQVLTSPTPTATACASTCPGPSSSPSASPAAGAFTCAASTTFTGHQPPATAFIDAMRTGTHAGYDRLTIEWKWVGLDPKFNEGQPSQIGLSPQTGATFTRPGPGDKVTLAGRDGLLVTIQTADSHTAYSGPTDIKTRNYPGLLEVRVVEDFEGYVQFALGLSRPACYRASILTNPVRLVIDIQTS